MLFPVSIGHDAKKFLPVDGQLAIGREIAIERRLAHAQLVT
jgi:hypothetical protein